MSILSFTARNFEEEFDLDPDDIATVPTIHFDCTIMPGVSFTFAPECGRDEIEWCALGVAVILQNNYILNWNPSNGKCSIVVYDDNVIFTVAKHGDGAGGDFMLSLPVSKMIGDTFIAAGKMTEQWKDKHGIARPKLKLII